MVMFSNLGAALSTHVPAEQAAIVDLGSAEPRSYSYAELDALIAAYARGFVRRGIQPGERIAIVAANSVHFIAIAFGALRAGITVVPVNYKLPPALVAFILEDSAARLVFCDAVREPLVPASYVRIRMDDDGEGAALAQFRDPGPFTPVEPGPPDIAMIIYTSGSSGVPKGVIFSHQGHLWALDHRTSANSPVGQRTIVAAPLYHQNGLASSQATLGSGGTVILLPSFEVESFVRAIAAYGVEMITAVPTMIAMLARRTDLLQELDFSRVKLVRVSSAPATPELMADIRRIFTNAKVVNGFGTTEAGPIFFGPHPDGLPQPDMSVGYAHPAVELRLVDNGEVRPDKGVLQIRSRAVMMGYLNKPELSATSMTDDGFYITGDIFERDANGFYYFVSRADDMFVCGGENVFPGDVEAMLMRLPAVAEVCVVPVPDAIKGQKPVAFVVPKRGEGVTEDEVKAFALANGPAYQHPRRVFIVPELPLASTNKVDRRALTERALALTS